jgi:SAM-dependent methyltransferase
MREYESSTYGDRVADLYDELYGEVSFSGDVHITVAFLRDVAGNGPMLELGIGTGRVALPLARSGVDVAGIDASRSMVAKLAAKPDGDRIQVTIQDFGRFHLGRRFRAIYVVFNTFFGLLSQEDQLSCFESVARHLIQDGVFVMEAFVPDPARFDRGQRVSAIEVDLDGVRLEVSKHDPIEQRTTSQHVILDRDGVRLFPVQIRYASIAELDLMARMAGMRVRERWGDWDRSPLTAASAKHVSVYELVGHALGEGTALDPGGTSR